MKYILLHRKHKDRCMEKQVNDAGRKRLYTAVNELTEENQRYVLGVLQALTFAQSVERQEANNQSGGTNTHKTEEVLDE
jgi:hypothetical protein